VNTPFGAPVKLIAKPAKGERFDGWTSGACTGRKRRCTLSAQSTEEQATASFAPKRSRTSSGGLAPASLASEEQPWEEAV
jgi:hypothetical protein